MIEQPDKAPDAPNAKAKMESRPVWRPSAQAWVCPFCDTANAVPERDWCACGATLDADGVATRG